jgi:hypothetical protein
MLRVASALKGYALQATDGRFGSVSDVLFDGKTWKIRWLVVDTGGWLTGRKVLIHPSAANQVDFEKQTITVPLTKSKIKDSPDLLQDQPVSRHLESNLYDYYGWDPMWGGSLFERGAVAEPFNTLPYFSDAGRRDLAEAHDRMHEGDPDLHSMNVVTDYHIQATDGAIGHLENLVIEDGTWIVRYLIVDTRNWWPGQHVLLSPVVVRAIGWGDRQIDVTVSRAAVRASPPWDPAAVIGKIYQKRLHLHYDWPGYGW